MFTSSNHLSGIIRLLLYTLLFYFTLHSFTFQTQVATAGCSNKTSSHLQKPELAYPSPVMALFDPLLK